MKIISCRLENLLNILSVIFFYLTPPPPSLAVGREAFCSSIEGDGVALDGFAGWVARGYQGSELDNFGGWELEGLEGRVKDLSRAINLCKRNVLK